MDPGEAQQLLQRGEYGFLAMSNVDGGGYGLPLNYVLEEEHLYFHCAPEGHKLENLAHDNRVTFTVVGDTKLMPEKFSTAYQSVMLFGTLSKVASEEERRHALRLLVQKYSPDHTIVAERYIAASFARTEVLRLSITHSTAKAKRWTP